MCSRLYIVVVVNIDLQDLSEKFEKSGYMARRQTEIEPTGIYR
jgi:hypothetical protein